METVKYFKSSCHCWLTHDRALGCVLDCLLKILEVLNQICIDTNESEIKNYRNLLVDRKALYHLLDGRHTATS